LIAITLKSIKISYSLRLQVSDDIGFTSYSEVY